MWQKQQVETEEVACTKTMVENSNMKKINQWRCNKFTGKKISDKEESFNWR